MNAGRCATCDRRVPWHYVGGVFGLIFAIAGLVVGLLAYDMGVHNAEARNVVRDACIGGSDYACRVYEMDYSR